MIEFDGERIDQTSPEEIVKKGISAIPEGRGIFPELTVGENIKVGAYTRKDVKGVQSSLQKVYEYFPILKSVTPSWQDISVEGNSRCSLLGDH